MSCVNKASQQFKDCCKRLDLSEQQLEQIVYDYTNQQGNENTFPTDTYIEQQLKGIPTSELSDSQRELYKLKYEEAQPLDTFEQAQQRVLELQQYYPDDRIKIIQRNNGKYQVVVNTYYFQAETEQEMQQIKDQAIADGTFMKAPNGKPTNLTERQWLQVRTKAFKDWFGDWINDSKNASKVVDENGEPLVMYHGSNEKFEVFDTNISDNPEAGSYFTSDIEYAKQYGNNIYSCFLNIKNPINTEIPLHTENLFSIVSDWFKKHNKERADGIIGNDLLEDNMIPSNGWEAMIYNSNQAKSVNNIGAFSTQDNNIYQNRDKAINILAIIDDAEKQVYDYLSKSEHKKANKVIKDANKKIHSIYPSLSIAHNTYELRTTPSLEALRRLGDTRGSLTVGEINELTQMLANKFNTTFRLVPESIASIKEKSNNDNTTCYIENNNGVFEIHFNKSVLPTYAQLAEELLHPLTYTIQSKNPELFNSFLNQVNKSKDSAIKAIAKKVEKLYQDKTQQKIDNEKVTQALAFMMKEANIEKYNNDSSIGSVFREILDWIVRLFTNTKISEILPNRYITLENMAYILKFENIKFQVDNWTNGVSFSNRTLQDIEPSTQEEQTQEPSYEERQLAISEQVSNLINNDRGLKATELRQLSEQMVYWMSEFISDCQDNPELVFQVLKITDYSNSDIEKISLMSRKSIVQTIGVENMFNLCKSWVLTPDPDRTGKGNANINTHRLKLQADLLKKNFQGLMQFSTSVWSTLEDFSIGLTETGYDILETSNPDAFLDEEQIKERDKQADGESTQESWQVESNTIDALTTATQLVKRELLHCYLYENTGEVDDQGKPIKRIKTNKFGINERLNPREAINAIIKWVQGCWDLNSMVAALKKHQDKNPWVEQLVNKLSDINGNESDFQSQFFSCMCRSFQLYGVVNENDKHELYQHSINKNPMLQMAFNGIKDLYKVGEHPLLKLDGVDRKVFKEFHEDIEQLINFSKKKYSEIENKDELNTLISHVYMLLGYYDTTPEVVGAAMSDMTFKTLVQNLQTLRTYLDNEKLNKQYNPFDFKANNSIISTLQNVLRPITYIMDDYAVTQFFESGNMRQSNVIPSFMTKLFSKMQLPQKKFEEFIEKEYGQFDWFYDKKLKKYKNEWLSRLVRMPEEERKKLFEHKVQLSFNKKQYMRGMTDSEYAVSVISEYFTAGKQTAWYKVPIMSNKPTSEFIKFIKYDEPDYKDRIVVGMQHIFVQELGRIQTIIKRQNAGINKSDPRFIKNFDKNGAKFCFLDFLNPFLNENKNTELGRLLNIKINGTRELSTEENTSLNDLIKKEIRNSMEARVQQIMESWRQQGILTAVSQIQGFERKPEKAESNWESAANNAKIENFIWNDTFAAMEILQLTITDVAQYKDAEDLQKRLAQIHAPGVRGNIQARDYFGNQVSDGTHRAVYLTDFDDFISNVIDNVTKVFDKKIAEAPENEKAQWKSLKESLVGKDGAYRQINVADAQAYACPTSYRKKAYMFGKWSREKERMYQQLMSGQYDFSTLKQAFGEPLKPFLYSYEEVDAGVENSPIETFKIGVQNKDSEYLLIMADALTRNEDTGIPNILRAIYDVMEESHKVKTDEKGKYIAATDGIDDIQFESTVKAGLYGRINLKQFSTDPQGEANAKNELRSKIFDGQGGYNSTYIHETRYEDYCIQQEVPEHFKDHSQAHGSQIRYIIPSDLPLTNANGETVVYSYFDPATGTERKLDAKQFKAEYENHCATNIQESLDQLKEEFGLVTPDGQISFDRKQMNQTLSEILKREILSSPRYGIDMLLACSLNADGEFNIPLGDPIQSRRIEQLINSIIKNRINKQKIAGGPVVQVTTFGTSRDLNIRFKSNKGGLLMTRKEFEKSKEEGTYEEYIEKYQDGIAYYEIYAPMYTNELFQQFADKDGNIDIKRIEKENPELLKIIGYRIPTEDKYSCFPAKIVGFLPREAGDAVMLPADITAITGSDFDVDKMYLMRKKFKEEKKSKEEITKELEDMLLEGLTGKAKKDFQEAIKRFMDQSEGKRDTSNDFSNPIVKAYANMSKKRFVEYTEGRQYHNNMIIDMSYSVLTNKEIAYQVLNPGGFDQQKRMGYAIAAYKDPEVRSKYSFEQLMEMPIDKGEVNLKSLCYKNKNLAFFDTQVQFYKQNSAAGMILGMFAVQKIAHAVLESDGFGIDLGKVFIDKNTNEQIPFGFCGIPFQGIVEVDKRFDANNQLIGKTLGSLVASAADAVKDPVLNLNNINNQTANVLTTMLRLGIVYEDAALLLSQPAITKVLQEHSKRMVNKEFISLNALIKARMQELDDKYYMSESEKIQSEPLNREDLIRGFSESDVVEAEKLEWKVLNAYLKFDQMSQIIKGLTNATRYNSVSNAVGPLIIDNLIMEYKAGKFSDAITYNGVEAKSINSVFNIHPILDKFSQATIIARRLLGEMPAYSSDFRILVNNSGDYTLSKIMGDRKLFSKLSDFYQSYLLVQSGFINPKDREYYTDKFPVEFMKYKEQYSDNPFVQAIRLSTGTFGGKTKGILTLDSVGMEQMQKDKLSSGWADLYKENPELAKKLFIYNFFKGGLGFSPKTFMNLVPISMKESIENNGIKYVDVFRHIPSLGNYSMIFDQFVGNNVGDFKLVPQRNPYSEHQNIQGNKIIITNKFENYELDYFKVKGFNNIYRIFKLQQVDPVTKRKIFVEIPVLGNQGEFFDVSATPINKSNVTNTTLEEEGFEPLDEEIVAEEGYDPHYTKIAIDIIKNEKGLKDTKEAYETLKSSRKTQEGLSEQEAEQRKAKIREAIMNSLKRRNITFNEEELNKTTNEFC